MTRCWGLTDVTEAMTVCAHEVAFLGFRHQPGQTSIEVPYAEALRCWIPVMILQSFGTGRVTAVNTSTPVRRNKVRLPPPTPPAQRPTVLLTTAITPCLYGILGRPQAERNFRCVVIAERRALEAERATVQRSHFSVDDHLCCELPTASDAHE